MLRDEEVDDVLDMLERHFQEQLSSWEKDFVADIKRQWGARRDLTSKQRAKLDEIAERCARKHGRNEEDDEGRTGPRHERGW